MSIRTIVMLGLGLVLLYLLFTVGAPFLIALVVAISMEPLTAFLMKRARINRVAASTISSTFFTLLLIGLLTLLGARIIAELIAFGQNVPQYVQSTNTYVQHQMNNARSLFEHLPPDAAAQLEEWLKGLTSSLSTVVTRLSALLIDFAGQIPNLFIFFIVFLVAVYMFGYSLNTMKNSFLTLFDEDSRGKVDEVLQNLRKSIFGFLQAQLILSALTYVIALTGFLILGVKFPLAIALLVVIVDILPILGTGSVLVPWAAYLLLTGNMYMGVGLLVLFIVITVFRRVVEPKVLGDSVGIGALSALISLYVGFKLVGVIGVFIGPLVVIIYMAARKAGLFQAKIKL
ncbi:sporulation protein [Paenibacillus darwinianus]|uniref:Sporulation protein n=1 Tax=Paenibacillus darwinianus TaxID=1380763 RepID=A0A9W5W8M6_9BACL|nr:sporulation integral membrane protein YtvI [Paenibacillus darwinianus]EXX91582.1 sporulation protein [Paenibacillus darwinianus]EXX91726.1 sporulation protein [Paenibacillus darwinianus]EXX92443.1 sporulation protein [Paenibacillus darwinianus]